MKISKQATIKTFAATLVFAIASLIPCACSNDKEQEIDGNHRFDKDKNAKIYKFNLSLGGDYVNESEEPLVRANDEPASYVGINVTRKAKDSTSTPTSEQYAYGVFTTKTGISIDLVSGYTYDFEATIFRDKNDTYWINSSKYPEPFLIKEGGDFSATAYNQSDVNKFIYNQSSGSNKYLCNLSKGEASINAYRNTNEVPPKGIFTYPRVDRYYGTVADIDPVELSPTKESVGIDMKYRCFGLQIQANIPDGTYLMCKDVSSRGTNDATKWIQFPNDLQLDPTNKEYQEIYCLSNLRSEDKEEFTLQFKWDKGMNEFKTFTASFSVGPKINKILVINIDGEANTSYTGNIILNEETLNLENENQTITQSGN